MKRSLIAVCLLCLGTFVAAAETYTGTVVDVNCKAKDAASHTRKCAIGCAKGGYGLVTANGKFLKFDETGNAKTLEALKASSKEKDLTATVNGKASGETLAVDSIALQ